ncbi:MAG TPA: hypothetical protein QKA14_02570, partial [Candidatus Megaira endosymbiont of Hartmannula sinica]|nr:hypothetical protein [Candidatus Megaera endosymbiont of Hartmannula sinica]
MNLVKYCLHIEKGDNSSVSVLAAGKNISHIKTKANNHQPNDNSRENILSESNHQSKEDIISSNFFSRNWHKLEKIIYSKPQNEEVNILSKIILVEKLLDYKNTSVTALDIYKFLSSNKSWPYKKALRIRMEALLLKEIDLVIVNSKRNVTRYIRENINVTKNTKKNSIEGLLSKKQISNIFTEYPPISFNGQKAYYHFAIAFNKNINDGKTIKNLWKSGYLSTNPIKQKDFYEKNHYLITRDDTRDRIKHFISNNSFKIAKENFVFLKNKQDISNFKTRILLRKHDDKAIRLFKSIDSKYYTKELVHDYLEYNKKGTINPGEVKKLIDSNFIAHKDRNINKKVRDIQSYMTRELIENRRYQDAYDIISEHFSGNSKIDLSQGEFMAGWIAFRFLDKPSLAKEHFTKFLSYVSTPVSKSRGNYWLAKTLIKEGKLREASIILKNNFILYPYCFYGQLSSLLANDKNINFDIAFHRISSKSNIKSHRIDNNKKSNNVKNKLKEDDSTYNNIIKSYKFKIAKVSSKYKLHNIYQQYMVSIINNINNHNYILKIVDLFNNSHPHHQLWIAKIAVQKNLLLINKAFPIPSTLPQPSLT